MGFVSLSYLPLLAALSLSVLLILFGSGPGSSSAKVNLGPLQPIEGDPAAPRPLPRRLFRAAMGAAAGGSQRRHPRRPLPAWINLPRVEYVLPVLVGVAAALMFFFFQKDLGPALFLCCVFLAVYAVARGRVGMAVTGLRPPRGRLLPRLPAAGLGHAGRSRADVAVALGQRGRRRQSGHPRNLGHGHRRHVRHRPRPRRLALLPAGHTDLILAAVGEELGAAGLIGVTGLFAILAWRGFRIAPARGQRLRILSGHGADALPRSFRRSSWPPGVIGLTPLTGVVTPFLSYGGSAMLANFAALGLLAAIHADARPANDFEPFRVPMRYLGATLGLCALVLVGVVARVQVARGRRLRRQAAPRLHADGGRRFEYNPRMLDLIRRLPRGTIYDRQGPAARDRRRARDCGGAPGDYEALGISIASACPDPAERCYPLGGRAFHILGDARTGRNWTRHEHVLRRARCRRQAARLRRPRVHGQDDRSRRTADVHDSS